MHLQDVVAQALATAGSDGLTVPEALRAVRDRGGRVGRAQLERALVADARFLTDGADRRARWTISPEHAADVRRRSVSVAPEGTGEPQPPHEPSTDALVDLELRDWQIEAFAAWAAAGCRGVVEAVTGTGKTRLAIAAVRSVVARGGTALILVPTLDLQRQWHAQLRTWLPQARIGRLGGGGADDLHERDVVVATPHSAAQVPVTPPGLGLLVADEAHRYGAPTWAEALREGFAMRLALTATYERNDDGLAEVLGPYFGGVVHRVGFARAAADGVIAPFRIALVGTGLDPSERDAYEAADRQMRQMRRALLDHGLPRAPLELIAAAAQVVAQAQGAPPSRAGPLVTDARRFLSALRARRDVAAQAAGKLQVAGIVAPALVHRRSLVFTDTVQQSEQATACLRAAGVAALSVHSELPDTQRRARLSRFRRGELACVVAPRVLDEGVDVPAADVAVVLAAFRSRRQMIQRLGRVLRVKPDGAQATLVVAYAKQTREDPAEGAHEDFLDEVLPVAREVVTLDGDGDHSSVVDWIRT